MTLILYFGAENETRTRDPNLGKVMLYQLSYFRMFRLGLQRYEEFLNFQIFLQKRRTFFLIFVRLSYFQRFYAR